MPRVETSSLSCGVVEFSKFASYKEPADALRKSSQLLAGLTAPFVLFTGVINGEKGNYSERLAAFIMTQGLGNIIPSAVKRNHTGNEIRLYMWEVNHEALKTWLNPEKETVDVVE